MRKRRERIEQKGSRERIENRKRQSEFRCQFEEEEKHHHLPLLVVRLLQGTAALLRRHDFQTRFCKRYIIEVLSWVHIIGRAKQAPHWGVQRDFGMSVHCKN